jgi:hypothetical protein
MGTPSDLVQETLDLLLLKTLSLETKLGWAIAERIQQVSGEVCKCSRDRLPRLCTGWSNEAGSKPGGWKTNLACRPGSIRSPQAAVAIFSGKSPTGRVLHPRSI